jgi:hypothetical protein
MLVAVAVLTLMIGVCSFYTRGVTVTVATNAPHAIINIDHLGRIGPTASFDKIPYGKRYIQVSHPEYEPFALQLSLGWFSFNPHVRAELKPRPVELTIQTAPGAEVFLSGASIGRAGPNGVLKRSDVVPGDYKIDVKLGGYTEWSIREHLGPPKQTLLAYLQPSPERLREIEINRAQVAHYIGEARRHFSARNYQAAVVALNQALELEPENGEAKYLRDQLDQIMKILEKR